MKVRLLKWRLTAPFKSWSYEEKFYAMIVVVELLLAALQVALMAVSLLPIFNIGFVVLFSGIAVFFYRKFSKARNERRFKRYVHTVVNKGIDR